MTMPYLRAVCSRYLSDASYVKDVLQEGYINIFNNIEKYDPSRSPFKNWAARICVNICLNYNKRILQAHQDITQETENQIIIPLAIDEIPESEEKLIEILKQMPQNYFEVFNMYIIEGYTHDEISTYLEISESLSRKRLSRARTWVKKRFKDGTNASKEGRIF